MTSAIRRAWIAPALLLIAGCHRAESRAAEKPASATEAPLPADVQDVANGVKAPNAGTAAGGEKTAARAEAGPDEHHLSVSGEFVSPMQSEVAAKITGRVGAVHVDEGARVRKGQPLLTLETEYLKLDVQRAEAELARAKAGAQEAMSEFERKQGLLAKQSVPQATFDKAQGAYDQARAAVSSAESALGTARQRLSDATLVSPVNGVVVSRKADVGEKLGDNSVAFVVAQTAPLRLRFKVPERYLAAVKEGQTVKAGVDPYPQETFEGKLMLVGESVDPATRTFTIEAEFPNRDGRLKPGLFARVELDLAG